MSKEIEAILRRHIKCDATGLAPAVVSVYLCGFEEAAEEISALSDKRVGAAVRADVGAEDARIENAARAVALELGRTYETMVDLTMDPDTLSQDDMRRAARAAVGAYVGTGADLSKADA